MSDTFACAAGCGATWPEAQRDTCSWERIEITGRLRCWDCGRALAAAQSAAPREERTYPDLPNDSLGALKKLPERQPLHEKVKS